jgi:hypothetical protein
VLLKHNGGMLNSFPGSNGVWQCKYPQKWETIQPITVLFTIYNHYRYESHWTYLSQTVL